MQQITQEVVEKLITATSLTPNPYYPLKVTFYSVGGTNVTTQLFGVTSFNLAANYWTITNDLAFNDTEIVMPSAVDTWDAPLDIRLTTANDILLATYRIEYYLSVGDELSILANNFTFSLATSSATAQFKNFLLQYIFLSVNPTTRNFSLSYLDAANVETIKYGLTPNKWSKLYTNGAGDIYYEYGETRNLNNTKTLKKSRLVDQSNVVWFDLSFALPNPDSFTFSNSQVLLVPDVVLSPQVQNSTSLVYEPFNGDLRGSYEYDSVNKLFGTECVILAALSEINLPHFVLPTEFTVNLFFYFQALTGLVTLLEKRNSFRLTLQSGTLRLESNGVVQIVENFTPSLNTWQHIWLAKTTTQIQLRTSSFLRTATLASLPANTNTFDIKNVVGFSNGLYLHSGLLPFELLTQPLPRKALEWQNLSFYDWVKMNYTTWIALNA